MEDAAKKIESQRAARIVVEACKGLARFLAEPGLERCVGALHSKSFCLRIFGVSALSCLPFPFSPNIRTGYGIAVENLRAVGDRIHDADTSHPMEGTVYVNHGRRRFL